MRNVFRRISYTAQEKCKTQSYLTLSSLQTKTSILANSVDPDERARNEPSYQDLHWLSFSV